MSLLRFTGVFFFLLTICVLAYWDIATFQDSLKWDMLDCYFPWKFFAAESIQNRVFPLWNPFQHLGYPIHADMRSVYYPEGFIVGLLGGYNLRLMNFLFVFYVTIAGFGFYHLASRFIKNEYAKITIAAAYTLCGFFVGHGQEMFGIIAAAWIPWILYYFIEFQRNLAWKNLWGLSFFLFLLLTGGYQALSLILLFLLIALFIGGVIKKKNRHSLVEVMIRNVALGIVVLLSLSVLIITYIQVSPEVERLTGLSLQDAYTGLLTPQALLSLLAPFSVAGDPSFLGTNITMANIYVGIITLCLSLNGLFLAKKWEVNILWVFGLFCLFASLGPHTPVREFLFNHVPGMNLFRMSSFFSYFSQVAFLILAGIALERLFEDPKSQLKRLSFTIGLVVLTLLTIVITSWIDRGNEITELFNLGINATDYTYHQRLFGHASIQVVFLLCFLAVIRIFSARKTALSFVVLGFVIIEMSVAVRLNFNATVGGGFDPKKLQVQLDQEPDGFPIPSLSVPLSANIESKPELSPLFHNTNIYSKTISSDGFNSFRLDRFELFKRNHPQAYLEGLEKPLLFSNSSAAQIEITAFQPARIVCKVNCPEDAILVLQQTYYTGWETVVNGKPKKPLLYNGIYPSVQLNSGTQTVVFQYNNKPVLIGFGASYLIFFLIVGACIYFILKRDGKVKNSKAALGTFGILLLALVFFGFNWSQTETMEEKRLRYYQELATQITQLKSSGTQLYLQVDLPMLMDSILNADGLKNSVNYLNGMQCEDRSQLITKLQSETSEHLIYAGSNLKEDRLVMELIQQQFPTKTSHRFAREYIHVFEKKGERETIYHSFNGFESANSAWLYEEHQKDTSAKTSSGELGWTISTSQMGSPPIILRVGDVTENPQLKLVFQTKALIPKGERNKAGMFIQIERNGEQLWHRAKEINSCSVTSDEWFETALVAEPGFDILPNDVLKVFVWGTDKGEPIYLDDMSFSIYPQD
ncbi:MAG: hypothetical protein ACI9LA_001781 [Bacteroidia bacterium]|jgi:hypothetical protein